MFEEGFHSLQYLALRYFNEPIVIPKTVTSIMVLNGLTPSSFTAPPYLKKLDLKYEVNVLELVPRITNVEELILQTDDEIDFSSRLKNLEITFGNNSASRHFFTTQTQLRNLRSLSFHMTKFFNEKVIFPIGLCDSLEYMEVTCYKNNISKLDFSFIQHCTKLRELIFLVTGSHTRTIILPPSLRILCLASPCKIVNFERLFVLRLIQSFTWGLEDLITFQELNDGIFSSPNLYKITLDGTPLDRKTLLPSFK